MSITNKAYYWDEVDRILEEDWEVPVEIRVLLISKYGNEIERDFKAGLSPGDAAFSLYQK